MVWWGGMQVLVGLNLCFLLLTYIIFKRRQTLYSDLVRGVRNYHFLFAFIYVAGCGFRSILPREDITRVVMVDSWVSCVAIGRSVATLAELSFGAQWAVILYETGKNLNNRFILNASKLILPLLITAECFSWFACTTTNYFGSIVEESLWAIAATVTVAGFIKARPYYLNQQRKFLTAGIVVGAGYLLYMIMVDVPSYTRNWLADEAAGKVYFTIRQGFIEVATRWTETRTYAAWEYGMVWMTLYFSLAVWLSMFIVNSPAMDKNRKQG